jgi:hypothetical protein
MKVDQYYCLCILYFSTFYLLEYLSQMMRRVQPFWESKNVAQIGGWRRVAQDVLDPVEAERQRGSIPACPCA